MRLIDTPPGEIASGEIMFDGRDLLQLGRAEMQKVRGRGDRDDLPGADDQSNPVLTIEDPAHRGDPACTTR